MIQVTSLGYNIYNLRACNDWYALESRLFYISHSNVVLIFMITVHTNNVNCEHHECEQQNQVSTAANKYNLYPGLLY